MSSGDQSADCRMMNLAIIAAVAKNRVIGHRGSLPWHLSADLRRFRALTLGKTVVMGRKTYQSIGRPLPQRRNIILTRDATLQAPGCEIITQWEMLLDTLGEEECFVIGGEALYEKALPYADKLYLTRIDAEFPGDTFFPDVALEQWHLTETTQVNNDPQVSFTYRFEVYQRFS